MVWPPLQGPRLPKNEGRAAFRYIKILSREDTFIIGNHEETEQR